MPKTHWKRLHNPDYLGAYSFDEGKDITVTIKNVANEMIIGADGKKEECMVMYFIENIKPLILNVTNAKTIQKLYKTPYIEEWKGRRIQLYVATVKAFGEVTDAVRVRAYIPKQSVVPDICEDCGQEIKGFGDKTATQIAQYTYQKYGKAVCSDCATKIKATDVAEDVLK